MNDKNEDQAKNGMPVNVSSLKDVMKEFVYKVLDILLFGQGIARNISGHKVRMPTRYYKYFPIDYELNNINFIHNYVSEGMTVIDVGAHIGLLSVILAQKVGRSGRILAGCCSTPPKKLIQPL